MTLEVEGESKPRIAYEGDVMVFSSDPKCLRLATVGELEDAKKYSPSFTCRPASPLKRDPDDVRRLGWLDNPTPQVFYFVEGATHHPCIVIRY